MLAISEDAQGAIKQVFKEKGLTGAVRIELRGACGGPELAMRMDVPRQTDDMYEMDGVTYLIDETLSQQLGEVTLDYLADAHRPGFEIRAENDLPEVNGCGTGCSC